MKIYKINRKSFTERDRHTLANKLKFRVEAVYFGFWAWIIGNFSGYALDQGNLATVFLCLPIIILLVYCSNREILNWFTRYFLKIKDEEFN